MNYKNILVMVFLILTISFSSASLEIIGGNNFNVVGDIDEIVNLITSVKNNGNQTLYNITFETNDHIVNGEIDELEPNQIKDLSFQVRVSEVYNGTIKIKGNYYEDIGTSDDSYEINIDNNNPDGIELEMKNINIYVGDEIKYINHVLDWVELWDVEHNEQIIRIEEAENYTKHFSVPEVINYVINRRGVSAITDVLTINVLSTTGYVHNPFDDTEINLEITPIYDDTLLNPTFTDTDFIILPLQETEDVFVLKNIGNFTAKHIELDGGDWITFDSNDFDLLQDQQKVISFTIKPDISNTSDTNKSYTKYIKVKGNFPTITQPIEVFVKYAVIETIGDEGDITGNFIDELIKQLDAFCQDNPENEFCYDKIYIGGDGLDDKISFNITRRFAQELMGGILDIKDLTTIGFGDNSDAIQLIIDKISSLEIKLSQTSEETKLALEESEKRNSVMRTSIISFIFSSLLVIIIFGVIQVKKRRDSLVSNIRQFG